MGTVMIRMVSATLMITFIVAPLALQVGDDVVITMTTLTIPIIIAPLALQAGSHATLEMYIESNQER